MTRSDAFDLAAAGDLLQRRQRYRRVRAVEHAGAVGARRGLGQLALARLLDDAVKSLQRANRLVDRHRVPDLDGRSQRLFGLHRPELPVRFVGGIQRVGGFCLRDDDPRPLGDESELQHHVEAGGDGADVAEIAAGEDDDIRDLPVELLHDLERQRLLTFEAEAVHRVGEVDAFFGGQALNDRHAAVEVGVEREDERAVCQRLHELRRRDASPRQDHDRRDTRGGGVCRQRRRRVTGRRAGDGADARGRRQSSA